MFSGSASHFTASLAVQESQPHSFVSTQLSPFNLQEYQTEEHSVSQDNMTLHVDAVAYNVLQDVTDDSVPSQIFQNLTWICNRQLHDGVELDKTVRPGDKCQEWFDRVRSTTEHALLCCL